MALSVALVLCKKLLLDSQHLFLPLTPVQSHTQFLKSMERDRLKEEVFFCTGFIISSVLLLLSKDTV